MFLFSHRYLRSTVLGLMLFLAGTAFCSCDSYDPDPYDDIPPLVTVEFSYVVPGQISNATVRIAFRSGGLHALSYAEIWQMRSVASPDLGHEQIVSMVPPKGMRGSEATMLLTKASPDSMRLMNISCSASSLVQAQAPRPNLEL